MSDKYNSKNSGKNRIDSIKITYNVPPKSPVKDFMVRCNRILKLIRDKSLYSIDVIKLYKQILFGKEDYKITISEFQYIDKKLKFIFSQEGLATFYPNKHTCMMSVFGDDETWY